RDDRVDLAWPALERHRYVLHAEAVRDQRIDDTWKTLAHRREIAGGGLPIGRVGIDAAEHGQVSAHHAAKGSGRDTNGSTTTATREVEHAIASQRAEHRDANFRNASCFDDGIEFPDACLGSCEVHGLEWNIRCANPLG